MQKGLLWNVRFFKVELCLGSDLKFLLTALGMQSASSSFPCPFCTTSQEQRADPKLKADFFNPPPRVRNLQNIVKDCDQLQHGVQFMPLLRIEPELIIPDTLHMRIRIFGKLLENVIREFYHMDCEENVKSTRATSRHIEFLTKLIRECGVLIYIQPQNDPGAKGKSFFIINWGGRQNSSARNATKVEREVASKHRSHGVASVEEI